MSVLNKLTEGIVERSLQTEGAALLEKWERTGLLEGLGDDAKKNGMARLLENQASQLLKEASTMSAGDVEGFASVAFPIVRRVFGGLIANDLVSVQPMSLPSGLIFFLDFQFTSSKLNAGATADESLYGGNAVGQQLTGGVDLDASAEEGLYALNNGYSSHTGSTAITLTAVEQDIFGGTGSSGAEGVLTRTEIDRICKFDPDLTSGSTHVIIYTGDISGLTGLSGDNLISISASLVSAADNVDWAPVRRLTQMSGNSTTTAYFVFASDAHSVSQRNVQHDLNQGGTSTTCVYQRTDNFGGTAAAGAANARGAVVATTPWGLENEETIPEIDIKVDSVSVTANTKKLKAKWSPELGQDLNAYHNLDAEVELTSILSEQIALEIDREILEDLVKGAKAGTYYWSRTPGNFLNRSNAVQTEGAFTGNVSEWYETLVETINDVSAQIHRKTLRGGANFVVCGPEVANVLEFTAGFRANVTADADRGTVGTVKVGNLSKKWDVFVDPYFPRSTILVGRKGGSFLESGYVYAPYVPLQVTPTIFGTEDFVPRKGVMTRYAKKMVRPDMYGVVVVSNLTG